MRTREEIWVHELSERASSTETATMANNHVVAYLPISDSSSALTYRVPAAKPASYRSVEALPVL